MVDNLRRSLAAPSSFLLAVAAWTLPSVPALLWTGLFVGSVAVPAFIPVLDGLIPRRWGISKRSHLRAVADDIFVALSQTFLAITMLAHQAWLMADAVVRTLGRLYVTKRNLLEWVPAAQAGYGVDLRLRAFYRHHRCGRRPRRLGGPARRRARAGSLARWPRRSFSCGRCRPSSPGG